MEREKEEKSLYGICWSYRDQIEEREAARGSPALLQGLIFRGFIIESSKYASDVPYKVNEDGAFCLVNFANIDVHAPREEAAIYQKY